MNNILQNESPTGRYKVEGNPDLNRVNGAIVNTNQTEYQKRVNAIKKQKKIDMMEERLDNIESFLKKLEPILIPTLKRLADK